MIAGIGCRTGVARDEVLAAIETAFAATGAGRDRLEAIAVLSARRNEPALPAAADALGVPLLIVEGDVTTPTVSARSLQATGHGSACEAAALLAAGPGATLAALRHVAGFVTCALAERKASS